MCKTRAAIKETGKSSCSSSINKKNGNRSVNKKKSSLEKIETKVINVAKLPYAMSLPPLGETTDSFKHYIEAVNNKTTDNVVDVT